MEVDECFSEGKIQGKGENCFGLGFVHIQYVNKADVHACIITNNRFKYR